MSGAKGAACGEHSEFTERSVGSKCDVTEIKITNLISRVLTASAKELNYRLRGAKSTVFEFN